MTSIIVKSLGLTTFELTWRAMQAFTLTRDVDTQDEIWLTEHAPVYTLGLNKKAIRMPTRDDIPIVETDRGGKITYHGPGQAVIYVLLDLKRYQLSVKELVSLLEQSVITFLAIHDIHAFVLPNAPGVYVKNQQQDTAKIASLGLRIKHDCSYHGLSVNVDMDLSPFTAIDPCGYAGLPVAQTKDFGMNMTLGAVNEAIVGLVTQNLMTRQVKLVDRVVA
jgi:lipoyl(octanoyl) transferase